MAINDTARAEEIANYQRELSREFEECSASKTDLRSALNAIDDFLDAHASDFNSAIPQPARSELTASQKARLFMFVMRRRYIDGV